MAIDGTWNIKLRAPMGEETSVLTLSRNGSSLTGTNASAHGTQEITNGVIDGASAAWKIAITTPIRLTLEFTGTLDGDTLSGRAKAGMFGTFPFTGTRGA